MPASPNVSVVIPMRNAGKYIDACLSSVLSTVDVVLDVVIVDDGSTDNGVAIARARRDPRIRIVAGPCKGIAAAMNCGLASAHGEIIMRCDADDAYPAGRIARQIALLQLNSDLIAVCGSFALIDEQGCHINDLTQSCGLEPLDIQAELLRSPARTHLCTFAVRRDALRQIGGFRTYFETAEDLDFQYRLANCGPISYVPEVFYLYRLHGQSITHLQPNSRRVFFERIASVMQQDRLKTGSDDLMRGTPPAPPSGSSWVGPACSAGEHIQAQLIGAAWSAQQLRNYGRALSLAASALRRRPFDYLPWKALVLIAAKSLWRNKRSLK